MVSGTGAPKADIRKEKCSVRGGVLPAAQGQAGVGKTPCPSPLPLPLLPSFLAVNQVPLLFWPPEQEDAILL